MARNKRKSSQYLIQDRIGLSFVEKDITHFLDGVDYEISDEFKKGKPVIQLEPVLTINHRNYSGASIYHILFLYNVKDYNPYDMPLQMLKKYSFFYPFNCSCGEPGCAGIWNGIKSKERRYTIEWRINKKDGYDFLEKSFYSFNRIRYEEMVLRVLNELKEKALDDEKVYVLSNDFYSTLKEDLSYWVEAQEERVFAKILNNLMSYEIKR